jgi:acyl dehydratase
MIAPPTFLFSAFDAVVGPGLPDVQWFYSGADWTFYRPVREGEEVLVRAILADAFEVSGKTVKRMIVQTGEVTYSTEGGELLDKVLSHVFRVPRSAAAGGLRYERREQHRYSDEEFSAIREAMLTEPLRDAETRWLSEEVPPAIRGPLNQLDMTCYYAGSPGTTGYKSTKIKAKWSHWARDDPDRIPNNSDPSYYAPAVSPSIGHQDARIARDELGMQGPYDNGPQRIGFMACCVTNWMGDDGFVAGLDVRIKLPVISGDTTFCKGRVVGKRSEDRRGLVDLQIWVENQLGQTTATGVAVVESLRRA